MNMIKPGDWIRNTYRVLHSFPFVQGALYYAEIPPQSDAASDEEESVPTRFLHGLDLRYIQEGAQLPDLMNRERKAFVPLQGLFVEKGILYQVYGKMEGTLMAHHLYEAVPLSLGETLDLLRSISGHLVRMEEQGQFAVIHPQNMLITADSVLFLYGGASGLLPKWSGNAPTASDPQTQLKQERALDAYSLGALTYIMLTGSSPQIGRSGKLEPIQTFRSDVPEGLEYFVMNSLLAKPNDRPTINQLRRWLDKIPVEADRQKKKDDLVYYLTPDVDSFQYDLFTRGLKEPQISEPPSSLDPTEWEGWEAGVIDAPGRYISSLSRTTNGAADILNPVWHKDSPVDSKRLQSSEAVSQTELTTTDEPAEETDKSPSDTSQKPSPRPVIFKQSEEKDAPSRRRWPLWATIAAVALLVVGGGGWAIAFLFGEKDLTAASPEERAEKAAQLYEESAHFYQGGDKDKALELAMQTVELNPQEKGYLLNLANLYGERKQYDDGVRLLKNGVKQIPEAEVYGALAVHAYYAEDWKEAERAIDRALSLEPNNPEFLYHQGKIQGKQGNTTAAIRSLQFAIDQDRNNALYHHDRAVFLLEDGDLERAKNYAWRAAKLDSDDPRYWITAGNIYLEDRERVLKDKKLSAKERRFESLTLARHAINFYSNALELDESDARTHYHLSMAYYYNEDLDAAAASAKQAVELKPDRALHHYQLGVVSVEQGDLKQAEESLHQAREIDPDNKRYQQALKDLN
ncbi:tetratricopeptide repeat protein [Desmospora activa]|uniref:Flp pilus assembly protein TadD n=1 Tax=Desmospora activa DSM 45169 TaxID=1121389 RepID=A0A2T4Z1V8_9BACL|nr:tetratricopeptide repeat protein [Desmospora activa]PTM54759.1 Flp pilus assembly protein TadD [Desmospora activa DSM 45169]